MALPALAAAGNLIRVPDDFPTVTAAVAAAIPGETVGVRAGTYPGEFIPKADVDVLGGYDPTFTLRDPEQFETILVGSPRVINCNQCTAGSSTLIDGFTMQAPPGNLEGAIAYIKGASPAISHCRFENAVGFRGGAMSLVNSATQLSDNTFVGNACNEVGGAVAVFSCTQARVIRCHFQGNTSAFSGAGIFLNASSGIEVQNSTFSHNNSTAFGGAIL
ncbi:MAG TPA: right-handed parallel beta-helix repeat-containing protein, partial [Candidatus Udaeobacter sp.]|nr:right-handed parallel beta-helix repeat-containing protein [Candidatus Udaeobacter sp.]